MPDTLKGDGEPPNQVDELTARGGGPKGSHADASAKCNFALRSSHRLKFRAPMPIHKTWPRAKQSDRLMSVALAAGVGQRTGERRWRLTFHSRVLRLLYRERAAPVSVRYKMGFKPSNLPLADQSAACLLLLALESRGLVIESGGFWVEAESAEPLFQNYTDSDWLDHRSKNAGS